MLESELNNLKQTNSQSATFTYRSQAPPSSMACALQSDGGRTVFNPPSVYEYVHISRPTLQVGDRTGERTSNPEDIHSLSRQPRATKSVENGLMGQLWDMTRHSWYWGPLTSREAEEKLDGQEDATFLVRDSYNERYLFSLSYRFRGRTSHMRIMHCGGYYSLEATQSEARYFKSVIELIEKFVQDSREVDTIVPTIKLLKPLPRPIKLHSLQHYCMMVIRQNIRYDLIRQLPLPPRLHSFLEATSILHT